MIPDGGGGWGRGRGDVAILQSRDVTSTARRGAIRSARGVFSERVLLLSPSCACHVFDSEVENHLPSSRASVFSNGPRLIFRSETKDPLLRP